MDMERILGLSLIGAGPGNIFGPGMSAGALESFAGAGRGNVQGGAGARGSAAAGAKTAAAPRGAAASGGKSATEAKAKEGATANGQEGRGADDDKARLRLHSRPALDGMFGFDAAVAPH